MVFTKLSAQEKDAFFALLDEYFQSRPDLLRQGVNAGGLAGTGVSSAAAASVVQRALAANATSSGKSNNPYASALANNASVADVPVGRVAAASLAFSQAQAAAPAAPTPSPASTLLAGLKPAAEGATSSLPRRGPSSNASVPASTAAADQSGSEVDKLVTRKASVLNAFKKPQTAGVAIPPAFATPKNAFAPPPVRRSASDTSGGAAGTGAARTSPAPRVPQRQELEEEAPEGEWAEVLYDYSSEEAGDLTIETGMRVWVTARSSEDWWTGLVEGQGKEGLFPASYVKLL